MLYLFPLLMVESQACISFMFPRSQLFPLQKDKKHSGHSSDLPADLCTLKNTPITTTKKTTCPCMLHLPGHQTHPSSAERWHSRFTWRDGALPSGPSLICSSSAAASAPRSRKPWSCPPSSWQRTHSLTSPQSPDSQQMLSGCGSYSVQVGVGMGVQGGRGLCSPPVRSDKEYLMLVYSRPLILLFCGGCNNWGLRTWGGNLWGVIWRAPALPRYASAKFLCSAGQPCRWTCTGLQSAPSQSAETGPSGWSLARRCHSPPLRRSSPNVSLPSPWNEQPPCKDSPFSLMTSIRMSITIKVPVLPIPALEHTGCSTVTTVTDSTSLRLLPAYLQWTAMGPASRMLSCFKLTSSKKSSTPPGSVGTPWSGQALKWYCQTVRSVLPWKHPEESKRSRQQTPEARRGVLAKADLVKLKCLCSCVL